MKLEKVTGYLSIEWLIDSLINIKYEANMF